MSTVSSLWDSRSLPILPGTYVPGYHISPLRGWSLVVNSRGSCAFFPSEPNHEAGSEAQIVLPSRQIREQAGAVRVRVERVQVVGGVEIIELSQPHCDVGRKFVIDAGADACGQSVVDDRGGQAKESGDGA